MRASAIGMVYRAGLPRLGQAGPAAQTDRNFRVFRFWMNFSSSGWMPGDALGNSLSGICPGAPGRPEALRSAV